MARIQSISTLKAKSEHILSTVRADDDEPIDEAWAGSGRVGIGPYVETKKCRVFIVNPGTCYALPIKTRGQCRRLCEGLGIQLKEKAQ